MEFEVKAPIDIPDGKHTGMIESVKYRDDPYSYADVWLSIEGHEGVELKYGCPSNVSINSKLGRLLMAFGLELKPGEKIDPEKYLVGKACTFMSIKKSKDGKEFSEIVEGSLKPNGMGEIETIKV